jgi:predicted RNase H-like HicB family nuclease
VPRHNEINEFTAEAIMKDLEGELGKDLVAKMRRKAYTAQCRRVGDWWAIDVPEVPRLHTQARRLDQVEGMARDAIALLLDVPDDSFDVVVQPVLPQRLKIEVERVRRLREEADAIQREATFASTKAVADLASKAHLTVRDIGRILGISHQRVDQLARKKAVS